MTANTDDDNIEIIGGEPGPMADEDADGKSLTDLVEQPAKVMRIGTMIKQLLEEVRAAPLDDASRNRLRDIHRTSIRELEDGLAPELRDELERLTLELPGPDRPRDRLAGRLAEPVEQPTGVLAFEHRQEQDVGLDLGRRSGQEAHCLGGKRGRHPAIIW